MTDLRSPRLIYAKGILFLLAGLGASTLVLIESPTLMTACLLVIAVFCFCRFYYFAFYVVEHYVDGKYRFAGLWDFAMYVLGRREPAPRKD